VAQDDIDTADEYLKQAKTLIRKVAAQIPETFQDAFSHRRLPMDLSSGIQAHPTQKPHKTPKTAPVIEGMVGASRPFTRALNMARRVAGTKLPVLITGESGTGKELIARMIHRLSNRSNGPFVALNAAAVPEGLLAGELFGYEKGAFTGADKRRAGKFEAAAHGTLFLDEIGDISPNLQTHLLRVIETGELQRLGSNRTIPVDTRLIFATNQPLEELVKAGRFRLDLYHRISGLTLRMPPLRERLEDIEPLVEYLSQELEPMVGKRIHLSRAAIELLKSYSFPGNIRELRNILQSTAVACEKTSIDSEDLARLHPKLARPSRGPVKGASSDLISEVLDGDLSLAEARRRLEYELVKEAMARSNGNISQAARLLKMKRPRLSQMVKELGLKGERKKEVL
jgi:transcriptional regulator with GAF, ATPase, and Fis domain